MKKIYYGMFFCLALITLNSCELDNYDGPQETLKGTVVDADDLIVGMVDVAPCVMTHGCTSIL